MAENNQPKSNAGEPDVLFTLDAKYLVAPNSTADELINDSIQVMDSAIAIVDSEWERLDAKMYGAMFLMKQAQGMQVAALSCLIRAGAIKG